ncbi:MAG: type VI secretion system baseplate subunit TssF, partial [Candidatus Marinimicrobia bacterium]|nr:type VI secretion system baseplate subunit TssF [Candidatus Neomarinimicrobiota bacterium]
TGKYKVKYRVSAGPEEKARVIEKVEPAEFIFRTTQDMVVRPIRMKEVRLEENSEGQSSIVLRIQLDRNIAYEDLELSKLRIYLTGPASLRYHLWFYFAYYFESISMIEVGGDNEQAQMIHDGHIEIPGLTDLENIQESDGELLPYSKQQFQGFRLLQEYFALPERFFFIDLCGLDTFRASEDGYPIEIKITFQRKLHREYRPDMSNILLHCVPIINLFDRPVEEVPVNQRLPEYHIIPDLDRRKSREIYSVNSVVGIDENRVEQFSYLPVTSYDILDTYDPEYEYKRFYSITRRELKSDMAENYIRLFGPSMEQNEFPNETLSLEATLSNGFLPAKYLEVGSITEPVDIPSGINVKNITAPTDVLPYPERKNYLWALISHLSLSYQSLAQTDNLKTLLSLYNWSPSFNNPNKKRIESIQQVHAPKTKNVYRNRGLIRGIEIKIELDGDQFEHGEGDLYLFGWVLNRFLTEYVTFNSYVMLTLVNTENNKEYTWEPKLGKVLPV